MLQKRPFPTPNKKGQPYENRLRRTTSTIKPNANTGAKRPKPVGQQPKSPQIDERVRGIVDTIELNGDVYLIPENMNYREWLFRITKNRAEGSTFQKDQVRACLVIELLSDDQVVECKPAPKKPKRRKK